MREAFKKPPAAPAHVLSQEKFTKEGPFRTPQGLSGPLQGFHCLNHHGSTSRKEDVSKETVEAFHQGGCMKSTETVTTSSITTSTTRRLHQLLLSQSLILPTGSL
ncbi:hypothetical protein AV530_007453 [Patagioenas fasciata monilis]|uniref:Uncharacterized protein n=1 Tax=Patagioenas fasciata monilis TaxID=372326 RepID=A0A1V4JY18_PATFA|nr:hypothetical protein AV530_007453 [Patagioenas fasciata monilis]